MVRTTTTARLVRSPFTATTLAQGGRSFVVGQAPSPTIIPANASGRRNAAATSLGTFIPHQTQNSLSEEPMSLIVQLGTTVVATSTPQMLASNSSVTIAKSSPTASATFPVGRNVSLNYPQAVNQITGTAQMQQHVRHTQVIQRPSTNTVANSNVKGGINCSMQQLYVQQQVVQPQQSATVGKSVGDARASTNEQGLERAGVVNAEEEKVGLAGRHKFLSNVSVSHQALTEERRMEIVKFVLQDHNYGAPPPASPPLSPSHHGKSMNGAASAVTLGPNSLPSGGSVYQYGSGLLTLRDGASNDDDANSVISSNTGREVEPEGEETETAPEGEGDDEDSVTRCICDFEHDDGYMICCDKCFVWQHVDCMGIDRSNIPDEYMCERCQPRRVDRQHARTLQLRKREELLNTDSSSDTSSSSSADIDGGVINSASTLTSKKHAAANTVSRHKSEPTSTNNKKNVTSNNNMASVRKPQRQRRESAKDQSQSAPSAVSATQRRASLGQNRKKETRASTENKRTPARRKSKGRTSEDESQDGLDKSVSNSGTMLQLRQWIDNYEEAVTNHYSPELRARISSIKVNGFHSDLKAGNLHSVTSGATKCRVSQLAPSVRILVSTTLLSANQPVIELRGKYMLSTQHRPPSLTVMNNRRTRPPPGPFIFFYRLPKDGTEVCVDTRTYGNDARFIRRSCKPNAEIRHCIEKGILHLYVVTISSVEKNFEITISHDGTQDASALLNNGGSPQQFVCACGNPKECTALNRRNGIHEPTDRERRRRGRRTTLSEDADPSTVSLQQHQNNVNSGNSQGLMNTNSVDGLPLRRTSTSARSPTKIPHEQPEQQQQQPPPPPPPPKQQQQKVESDHDQAVSDSVPDQQDKKRKLTREERKMEAIMKAFERLEKAEQRRQENQAKQAHRKEHQHDAANSSTSKKEPVLDTKKVPVEVRDEGPRSHGSTVKPSTADRQRRKRRRGRGRANSTSQHPPPPQRRRTRLNSGDSDMTSADEAVAVSSNTGLLHSPQASSTVSHQPSPVSAAAGLLLALASGSTPHQDSVPSYQHTPPHLDRLPSSTTPQAQGGVNPTLFCDSANSSSSGSSQGSTPPTPLSSACLLVAAAVGPLAPGFKFPKTKKVLMNEWLNKSPELPSTPSSTIPPPLTSPILLRPSELTLNPTDLVLSPQVADSYGYSTHHSPSKSLATLTQAANRVALGSSAPSAPLLCRTTLSSKGAPSAPGGGVGSAKKRWLRQAISEECDSPTTNSCASPNSRTGSPPCPDYVTPLKKRRLARESLSSEQSVTPPTTPTMLTDHHLSSNSPLSQKCAQYDVTGMNLGGCEEDDTVASPVDDETHLINDGDYEGREEKCEQNFDGHCSPINDCYARQGAIKNVPVTDYPTHSILLQGDENDAIMRDGGTDGVVLIGREIDQSEQDDTDLEEKEKEEIEEHIQARESSVDGEDDDDDNDDETPASPLHDIESEATLRENIADVRFELSVNSSEETEEEGCRGFEDQEGIGNHDDSSKQGCEDTVGSETEILNGNRTVVDVNVKEQGTASMDSSDVTLVQHSFTRSGKEVAEISSCSDFYQKMPEVTLSDMESGYIDSCKGDMSVELHDSTLKHPQVSRDETLSAAQTSVVSSATAQPAKRKVRTLSISEYRQRKQRNSSTELNSGGVECDVGTRNSPACRGSRGRTDSSSSSSSSVSSDDDAPNAGASVASRNLLLDSSPTLSALPLFLHTDTLDDKRGVGEETYMRWNSAPTLVERQRENLTERLRREFGLFLSDDEEQERARKQGLVQDAKDGKKKAPPPLLHHHWCLIHSIQLRCIHPHPNLAKPIQLYHLYILQFLYQTILFLSVRQ
ncbi:Histone-lysine N-methyltransferase MLL5 [Zootermopsis nevadensis]|uniref:Histone-lysine N-methyltransferase MLL5 n=1 Tax=Zootermopsis nevadensis TaxID=136037 RepID=A0A067R0D4_ZOONE|nr:Histone-lysine N-methyltransferase MLL5 [Zootermopsis nevadensis]